MEEEESAAAVRCRVAVEDKSAAAGCVDEDDTGRAWQLVEDLLAVDGAPCVHPSERIYAVDLAVDS